MKQIPSQFLDDSEYDELIKIKEKNNWTWKDLLLEHIKKEVDLNGINRIK